MFPLTSAPAPLVNGFFYLFCQMILTFLFRLFAAFEFGAGEDDRSFCLRGMLPVSRKLLLHD